MADGLAFWLGLVAVFGMLGGVLGSVERPERYRFALGVVLVLLGLIVVPQPPIASKVVVLAGLVAILASTVPLLRQSIPAS